MAVTVEIARHARAPLSDAAIRRVITATIRRARAGDADRPGHTQRSYTLSIACIGPHRMRALNRTYHGEDRVTDVLTFPGDGPGDLGEIVICPAHIRAQARRAGEPFRRECTRVLVHGMLHLCGYDHAMPRDAERMFGAQEAIVRGITL